MEQAETKWRMGTGKREGRKRMEYNTTRRFGNRSTLVECDSSLVRKSLRWQRRAICFVSGGSTTVFEQLDRVADDG
jgi:hypothetical protein